MPITPLLSLGSPNAPDFEERVERRMEAEVVLSQELNVLEIDINEKYNAILSAALVAGGMAAAGATATAAAVAALAARDQALAAWSASMAGAETLPALSQSMHFGGVVALAIDVPSLGCDGGAWTDRCQGKSWYAEPLGGDRWIGQRASNAAAWSAAGSAGGAVYQSTADGKYYTPTSSSAQTEVFRGIRRDYPAGGVAVVIEPARVVVYDISTIGCPMFKVIPRPGKTLTSVAVKNGAVIVGSSTGLFVEDFACDKVGGAERYTTVTTPAIVANSISGVAVTELPNAPTDPVSGLPVLTLGVATTGGVSVIRDSGVIFSISAASVTNCDDIAFVDGKLMFSWDSATDHHRFVKVYAMPTANIVESQLYVKGAATEFYTALYSDSYTGATEVGFPYASATDTREILWFAAQCAAQSSVAGACLVKRNPANQSQVMQAYITNTYSSGWLVGAILGAYMADTAVETLTAPELITNGAFATNTSGWAAANANLSRNGSGQLVIANTSAWGAAEQNINTVAGKCYCLQFEIIVAGSGIALVNASALTPSTGSGYYYPSAAGKYVVYFVATSTITIVRLISGSGAAATSTFDNVSVKLTDPDRSVKHAGLLINGTLTKAPVATGASLAGVSGFSVGASGAMINGLGGLNAALGGALTADFAVYFWRKNSAVYRSVRISTAGPVSYPYTAATGTGVFLELLGNSVLRVTNMVTGTASPADTDVVVPPVADMAEFCVITRVGNVFSWFVNGIAAGSVTAAANATGTGLWVGSGYDTEMLSLLRLSATVPSADQIAHIYRTEAPLFQSGAQCTIAGTSTAVTAMAFDGATEVLQVGTSWGRSGFKDLLRVDSDAATTGVLTSLAATQGAVLTGGASSAKVYQPSLQLRDELRQGRKRNGTCVFDYDLASFTSPTTLGGTALTASSIVGTPYEGMAITGAGIAAGTTLVKISGTAYTMSAPATATNAGAVPISQSSVLVPKGWTVDTPLASVLANRQEQRLGATKDYVVTSNGFQETVAFATSPGSASWVRLNAIKG